MSIRLNGTSDDIYTNISSQKTRRKLSLCGCNRRFKMPNRRPLSERHSYIEDRKRESQWEGDTVIVTAHKPVIATHLEHMSGFAVLAKVPNN